MECIKCKHELSATMKFCFNCGEPNTLKLTNSQDFFSEFKIKWKENIENFVFNTLDCGLYREQLYYFEEVYNEEKDWHLQLANYLKWEMDIHNIKKELDLLNYRTLSTDIINYYNSIAKNVIKFHSKLQALIIEDEVIREQAIHLERFALDHDIEYKYVANQTIHLMDQFSRELPFIEELANDDWLSGLGNLAKGFGEGALVAVNPLIGIPLLIKNYFSEEKKSDQVSNKANDLDELNKRLCSKWDESANLYIELDKKVWDYINKIIIPPLESELEKLFLQIPANELQPHTYYLESEEE